ncbi:MAG: VWA domain-containing protein [Bacteroidia bacterium]|nr:VWA domain-containing protein [Bacteroidia bacterium]
MNVLRLAHPEYLYALWFIPVIMILFFLMRYNKRKAWKAMGDKALLARLLPDASKGKPVVKMLLYCIAFALITIGLANPQMGSKMEEVKREGIDVIIALDISNSMMAEDIKPSRLERAKQSIARFIDRLENDRVGLIVFAGKAYVQLPITTDFNAAKLFLSSVNPGLIPTQGTAIGSAINLAVKSFTGKDNKHKALVIITDGENHEDDALEAAKNAAKEGIVVHTIGMGSPEGAPIPVFNNGTRVDFLKDQSGTTVITKLNREELEKIAQNGKGIFVRASNAGDGMEAVMKEISKMEKKSFGSKQYSDYEDQFQYFIAAGLLVLMMEFLISNRKSKWLEKLNLMMGIK